MKQTAKLSALLMLFFLCFASTGCNSDSNYTSVIPDNVCYDFVTFVNSTEAGSTFTFRKNGDSELITLTSVEVISTQQVTPGTRIIIQYLPTGGQAPYESGAIKLYGIAQVINGDVEDDGTLAEIEKFQRDPLKMLTFNRSGEYIDIWAEAYMARQPKTFGIVADESTLDNEYPDLYIEFETDDDNSTKRQFYASLNIKAVLDRATCKGVNVHYKGQSAVESVKFDKDTTLPIEPAPID